MRSFEGNRVIQHTGTEFPIFQAPIGLISRAPLVGAVAEAGGVGLLETASLPIPQLQEQYEELRGRTDKPFGIHLMVGTLSRMPDRADAVLDWALDGKTRFVTTGYGDPTRFIQRIKDAGVVTYHLTDSIDEALRAQDAGVDGVVLGGAEKGGGHRADALHTFALLQKARKQLHVPIVASGGIVDGIGMAAAFALGAEGIWMGTRFIASAECPWSPEYKQEIVDCNAVISIDLNFPVIPSMRAVRNQFSEAVSRGEAGDRNKMYAGEPLKLFYEGRTDLALAGCGESGVLIDEVKSAGQIVRDTVDEFWTEIERLSGLLTPRAVATV
ncbi:MAG: nitronate monooxygenase [Dehalococcoidia bacterium]|nr:nitronate monooxygenase [Dehalococcoidia bacterium]